MSAFTPGLKSPFLTLRQKTMVLCPACCYIWATIKLKGGETKKHNAPSFFIIAHA